MRIGGLAAGTYDVFFMPRFGTLNYAMTIDIGVNISDLTANSFTSPALASACSTWVEGTASQGGNYFRKEVTISGPSDHIVMLDHIGTEYGNNFVGFQIAQVPEPTSRVLLLSGGSVMLVLLRRRLRKARI